MKKMTNSVRCIIYMLVGAVAFWTPNILLSYRRGYDFEPRDQWLVLLLLPWALFAFYRALWRWGRVGTKLPSMAVYMLFGVWLTGSLALMAGATFSGGGFNLPVAEVLMTVVNGIFPPYTFMMAMHDGSLYALMAATLLMCLLHLKFERQHWIVPPGIINRFKKLFAPSPYR